MRFRRTLKIMPGVRLNFSLSGVSASVGPRGASMTIGGGRSPAVNLGIPGTGLSIREHIGSSRLGSGGPTVAQMDRWERAQAREAERAAAVVALTAHEARLDALQSILRRRDPHPIDWTSEFSDPPALLPSSFTPPGKAPTLSDVVAAQSVGHPMGRWGAAALGAAAGAWLAPAGWLRLGLGALAVGLVVDALRLRHRLMTEAPTTLGTWDADFTEALVSAQAAHVAALETAQREHDNRTALHAQFRTLVADKNVALAASFLELELSNEDVGVEIEFDIEFEDIHHVRLSVTLPGLEEIPSTRAELTQTGKLSQRKVSQRDRGALYQSVCAGVVLRLVYEAFRVLPFVERVQAVGMVTRPGLGSIVSSYPALALDATRHELLAMDLDGGDPAAVLHYLGGLLEVARDGTLRPVEAPYASD